MRAYHSVDQIQVWPKDYTEKSEYMWIVAEMRIHLLVGGHGGTILYKHRVEYAIHKSKSIHFSNMARNLDRVL